METGGIRERMIQCSNLLAHRRLRICLFWERIFMLCDWSIISSDVSSVFFG